MKKKVENLSIQRNKKKPRSVEAATRIASERFRKLVPDDIDEPQGFASGDPKKSLNPNKEEE